jgi:hypothetical protein
VGQLTASGEADLCKFETLHNLTWARKARAKLALAPRLGKTNPFCRWADAQDTRETTCLCVPGTIEGGWKEEEEEEDAEDRKKERTVLKK